MFTRIVCPNCGHAGATAAPLPRVLVCSHCEHGALIKSGTPAKSSIVEREEEAAGRAAWERYAPPDTAG
jgi:DNA-directed RNA polymerase subunit RPC12/RpoP